MESKHIPLQHHTDNTLLNLEKKLNTIGCIVMIIAPIILVVYVIHNSDKMNCQYGNICKEQTISLNISNKIYAEFIRFLDKQLQMLQ